MRRRRNQIEWPRWCFGPDGESQLFEKREDVPEGWFDKPPLLFVHPEPKPEINKESVLSKLKDLNIEIDPRWGRAKLQQVLDEVTK